MIERRIDVKNTKPERKFFKVYYDFLYNEMLSGEEKFLFSTLKSFLDFSMDKNGTEGEAFPTIQTLCKITSWGNQKVTKVIDNLVEKKVVKKVRRGLTKSNLYIIADYEEMWTAKSPETVEEAEADDKNKSMTLEDYITEIRKMGYEVEIKEPASASDATTMPENRVTKEKEPVSERLQTTDTGTRINNLDNDTTGEPKSQEGCSMSKANADEPESQEQDSMSKDGTDATFDRLWEQYLAIKGEKCDDSIDEPESQESQTPKASTDKPKSQEQDSASEADADALFDRLWKLYPVKKGKGRISAAQKKKLLKIGYDEMARAIERYKQYVESVDYLHYQYGSTFFTGGYVDYLDANYDPESDRKAKGSAETKYKPKKNRFNDYPTREYDFDAIKRTMFLQ